MTQDPNNKTSQGHDLVGRGLDSAGPGGIAAGRDFRHVESRGKTKQMCVCICVCVCV